MRDRGSAIFTLLLDTLVILTAVVGRWLIIAVIDWASPIEQRSFVVTSLEKISDYGIVLTAVVFAVFDLAKVIVRAYKSFARTLKDEESHD